MAGFFGFFDYTKPGKGVDKEEFKPDISTFFRILFGRFWKFMQLNMLYFVCSLPMFAVMLLYVPLENPDSLDNILATYRLCVFFLLYFAVVGIAPLATGFTYVIRNFSSDRHSWVFSDFFEQIKKNYKQAFALLAIDVAAVIVFPMVFTFYTNIMALGDVSELMRNIALFSRTIIMIVGVIFFMAHFYIYQIMITFDMKLLQILKNSLIFAVAHLPRNVAVLVLIFIIAALVFGVSSFVGILLSFLIAAGLISFTVHFITQPVVVRHMMKEENSAART